ncbi:MAG TPA: class I SAM-dependent methyltransferase, partial [Actinomycetota bacterium]|nr:class I SAM-dependent methyltransferase [Actinomycetota bacterium]
MREWNRDRIRHALSAFRYGRNPAATVYDSIGADFPLALAPGWLNLGLWEGDGADPAEAPAAVRRLVERLASVLPTGGDVLDVGNGLAAQDPVIAEMTRPRSLTALNITWSQLDAGRERLRDAGARAVCGDACRMPFADGVADGVISVEAAFHFSSRADFFREAFRVLRPGGVLSMSDVPTMRFPRGPREAVAAAAMLRAWGLRTSAVASPELIAAAAGTAGFEGIRTELVGDRVIAPALRFVRDRLDRDGPRSRSFAFATRVMVRQADVLWERGLVDYLLLEARKPGSGGSSSERDQRERSPQERGSGGSSSERDQRERSPQ